MWCPRCQAEVAAQLAGDNQRLLCTHCAQDIGRVPAPVPDKKLEARELLARWSAHDLLPLHPEPPAAATSPATQTESPQPPVKTESQRYAKPEPAYADGESRIEQDDPSHAGCAFRQNVAAEREPVPTPTSSSSSGTLSNLTATIGQICAYFGVGLLTCGTALVLVGYFGDRASFVPTGWLMTTAGQMLLFLGVVTLVSGGLEQTNSAIDRRISDLEEHILRTERRLIRQTPAPRAEKSDSQRRAA